MKSAGTESTKRNQQRYERTAVQVKENLIAQFRECNRRIIEWEKTFIATHGIYPDPEDIPQVIAIAMWKDSEFQA